MRNARSLSLGVAMAAGLVIAQSGSADAQVTENPSSAHRPHQPCQPGEYLGKTAKRKGQTRINLSGVYSKRNSNPKSESTLSFAETTTKSTTTTFSGSIGASGKERAKAIKLIEGQFKIDVSKTTLKNRTLTNTMVVRPKYYGRTSLQSIKTKFYVYQKISRGDCSTSYVYIGSVNAITSAYHFAECQDKSNACRPY
jgi:hypothetical protein